jgi:hypothetical protein
MSARYYDSHPLQSNPNASAPHGRGWFNVSSPAEKKLVLGAEACLWGEHTNEAVMNVRVWPRTAVRYRGQTGLHTVVLQNRTSAHDSASSGLDVQLHRNACVCFTNRGWRKLYGVVTRVATRQKLTRGYSDTDAAWFNAVCLSRLSNQASAK